MTAGHMGARYLASAVGSETSGAPDASRPTEYISGEPPTTGQLTDLRAVKLIPRPPGEVPLCI